MKRQGAASPLPFVAMFEQTAGLLPEQVALFDEDWNILSTNAAWVGAVRERGHEGLEVGGNYHEFCIGKAAEGYPPAIGMLEGIAKLDSGAETSFRFVHEGTGPLEGSIFQIWLRRTIVQGRIVTVATRTDITELRNVRDMRERLGEILIEGRADERRRLARELHDSTMQQLHSLTLALGQLRRSHPSSQTSEIVEEMDAILNTAQSELRTMSYLAHPPVLDELGLRQALRMLVDGFGRRSGVRTSLDWRGGTFGDHHLAEVALYRIVQEALSNVHRHARAENASVKVKLSRSTVEVRVIDDGKGMSARPPAGVGVAGMRARLEELGGRLEVNSSRLGTEIVATVPRLAGSRLPSSVPMETSLPT